MDAEGSKIKFGFSKIIKKPNLLSNNAGDSSKSSKIEIIESIEGQSMKILGKNASDEAEKKLIIPMTNDQRTTPLSKLILERKLKDSHVKKIKTEPMNGEMAEIKQEKVDETLEQQAARELMEDLHAKTVKSEVKIFEVPMNPDELPLDGAKESSLDDYDRVPIGDFGKAMLRGMGWKDEEKKDISKELLEGPVLRPKGMGLGADKVIKKQPLLIPPTHSETLEIKKKACVKVLAGKHKNLYGTIEGFDDGGGRVIVKLAIGALKVTLNEFMVQPISKQEFATYAKILNSTKYEEYKSGTKIENVASRLVVKKEEDINPRRDRSTERHKKYSRERSRSRETNNRQDRKTNDQSESCVRKYRDRSRSKKPKRRHSSTSDEDNRSRKKSSNYRDGSSSSPDSRYKKSSDKKHKKKSKKSKKKRDRS